MSILGRSSDSVPKPGLSMMMLLCEWSNCADIERVAERAYLDGWI